MIKKNISGQGENIGVVIMAAGWTRDEGVTRRGAEGMCIE